MTIVDNRTPNRSYAEPYETNDLYDDVARLVSAIRGIDTDMAGVLTSLGGKASVSHHHPIAEIDGLQGALDGKAAEDHEHALDDLSDVDVSAADDGMYLRRVAGQWVAALVEAGDFGFLQQSSNLSDLTDIKAARQNIGLYRKLSVANADTNLSGPNAGVTEVLYTAPWTASRTITLPLASSRNPSDRILLRDPNGHVGTYNPVWQAQGSDTVGGMPTFANLRREVTLVSDGANAWSADHGNFGDLIRSGDEAAFITAIEIALPPGYRRFKLFARLAAGGSAGNSIAAQLSVDGTSYLSGSGDYVAIGSVAQTDSSSIALFKQTGGAQMPLVAGGLPNVQFTGGMEVTITPPPPTGGYCHFDIRSCYGNSSTSFVRFDAGGWCVAAASENVRPLMLRLQNFGSPQAFPTLKGQWELYGLKY